MKPQNISLNTVENKKNVYLGLSSNIGDLEKNLINALDEIAKLADIIEVSSLYKTEPVGYKDQDWFLNIACKIRTKLPAQTLLKKLLAIETKMGRVRLFKDGPRNIDIDILYYEDKIINSENLTIPHPEIQNRNFVLSPLKEIEKDFLHPILKKNPTELYDELKNKDEALKWKKFYKTT